MLNVRYEQWLNAQQEYLPEGRGKYPGEQDHHPSEGDLTGTYSTQQ